MKSNKVKLKDISNEYNNDRETKIMNTFIYLVSYDYLLISQSNPPDFV